MPTRDEKVRTIFDEISSIDDPIDLQEKERMRLIREIEERTRSYVAVLYHNTQINEAFLDDTDAEMLEDVFAADPPKKRVLLFINSNGGLPLAAERLVHVCRTYAPKGFQTMVVHKAKSAATMVCLGSDKIYMTETAELGPIDPQIVTSIGRSLRTVSVDSYVEAYDKLMEQIKKLDMNESSPAGLLQQLQQFDPAYVEEMRKARELGRDMTKKFLMDHMLKGETKQKIETTVNAFSESKAHKSHGIKQREVWRFGFALISHPGISI